MPRIPHSLLLQANKISSLLPLTLRVTRDLQSAKNELRWLIEHVQEIVNAKSPADYIRQKKILLKLCQRRERGEPLQYILGSQPFGDLDIKCRHGVLIPRPETEDYTAFLADLLLKRRLSGIKYELLHSTKEDTAPLPGARPLDILDICSGSGCISLLLHSKLSKEFIVNTSGWDISQKAIDLALENKNRNKDALATTRIFDSLNYDRVDVFRPLQSPKSYDIVISNPPYIHSKGFNLSTSRSVRNWEPKLALVPEDPDTEIFYRRILELERDFFKSKILVMETGSYPQARRVAKLVNKVLGKRVVEFWRDVPGPEYISLRQPPYAPSWGRGSHRTVVVYGSHVPWGGPAERVRASPLYEPEIFDHRKKQEVLVDHQATG